MAEQFQDGAIQCNRFGYTIGGELYQRVTTIKSTLSTGDALVNWAGEEVAKEVRRLVAGYQDGTYPLEALLMALQRDDLGKAHEQTRDKAADFGTAFHRVVEAAGTGDWNTLKDLPLSAEFWQSVEQFRAWSETTKPVWERKRNEFVVFHPELKVAGQVDAIATIGEETWLIDVKTSKQVYATECALQLAAYKYAPLIARADGGSEPMPKIDRCGILHVPKTGDICELHELEVGEPQFAAFQACHQLYWYKRNQPKPTLVDFNYELAFAG